MQSQDLNDPGRIEHQGFNDRDRIGRLISELKKETSRPYRLMEVCGTHTMAIAKMGLKQMLPKNIKLLSGPGCPVCVTPAGVMDEVLRLSENPDVILASYGDMIRVPGSVPGDNLQRRKALGAKVEMVYSALDAVELAEKNPGKHVVFLGVGFETTAPGTAVAILEAKKRKLSGFHVLCMLKRVEPALRALIEADDFQVDGFLCPGHVATIIGEEGFRFLTDEYRIPAVITGFEAGDITTAVYELVRMIRDGKPALWNEYTRAVRPEGNPAARAIMERVFEVRKDVWRGLGTMEESGLKIRDECREFDAELVFDLHPKDKEAVTGCRCGQIIRGVMDPGSCPLFGKACTPDNPVGPCMVSGEGACAAAYRYGTLSM